MKAREARILLPLAGLLVAAIGCDRKTDAAPVAPGGRRIVSVGPGVTETLFALGLGGEVVGIDASSMFPDEAKKLPRVGYHRLLSAEGILSLEPTHLAVTTEAGPADVLEALRAAGVVVTVYDTPVDAAGVATRIRAIAETFGKANESAALVAGLERRLEGVRTRAKDVKSRPRVLVLYARGENLLFVAGKKTGPDLLLEIAGAENVGAVLDGLKPLTPESAFAVDAEYVVVPASTLATYASRESILRTPGIAGSRAAAEQRLVVLDDQILFALGPRTGEGAESLFDALHAAG